MKLRVKKLPKERFCESKFFVSTLIRFGRTKLQVTVQDLCGRWRATLGSPTRSRYIGATRRRRHSVRVHIAGYGKTKAAALADLDKAIHREIKTHKALETWILAYPVGAQKA